MVRVRAVAAQAGRGPARFGDRHGTADPDRVCRRTSYVLGPKQTMEAMAVRGQQRAGRIEEQVVRTQACGATDQSMDYGSHGRTSGLVDERHRNADMGESVRMLEWMESTCTFNSTLNDSDSASLC